ncbi:MAG: transposase IS605 [Mycoplasmataceae bacterium RV_VA103A]|nr:MAG: transposase IS605 [Mycoplasmataceae bacterium RV_VA103A]
MKIIKSFQYYIKTNTTNKKQLENILFGCSFLYNELLKDKIKRDKDKSRQLTLSEQSKLLTKLRKEKECLQITNRQILNEVIIRVNKTWNNHFRFRKLGLAKGYPKIKQASRYNSFVGTNNQNWKLENDKLVLSQSWIKGKGGSDKITLKVFWSRPIEGDIQTLVIARKSGRWYANFICEVEIQPREMTGKCAGMDLNLKKNSFCVLSDGTRFNHPLTHKKNEKRLTKLQQLLSKKQKGSKNREKTRLLYSKQWEKVKNQQKDTFFKMANEFKDYDGIARENLKIINMIKNRSLSKAIVRASWANFVSILAHRVEDTGGQVVKVNPYNTTQRCSNCKELTKEKLTLKNRVFYCWNCGLELDRDVNSARNILDKAIENNRFGQNLWRGSEGIAYSDRIILV